MWTSTKILEKLESALMSPGWTYSAMWHFPPFAPPTWAAAQRAAQSRDEAEVRR